MKASIIIPTYNRWHMLLELLESIRQQDCPTDCLEVIIVDDGSADETLHVSADTFPFKYKLVVLHGENVGGVSARNRGVLFASGEILIFLDDDMILYPTYVSHLIRAFEKDSEILVRGMILPWENENQTLFTKINNLQIREREQNCIGDFTSNNLALRKDKFLCLGGWQEVIPGEPGLRGGIWADLLFAYRAHHRGLRLVTVQEALIIHCDYVDRSLQESCSRAYKISLWAPIILEKHPELNPYLPMFSDKNPIQSSDNWKIKTRKILRAVASLKFVIVGLTWLISLIEAILPLVKLLEKMYQWLIGEYIYRGYQDGLRIKKSGKLI